MAVSGAFDTQSAEIDLFGEDTEGRALGKIFVAILEAVS